MWVTLAKGALSSLDALEPCCAPFSSRTFLSCYFRSAMNLERRLIYNILFLQILGSGHALARFGTVLERKEGPFLVHQQLEPQHRW